MSKTESHLLGISIILYALIFGLFVFYTVLVSKFVPKTGHSWIDFWHTDIYYSLLIPATIPTVIVFAYWAWASSQFFRYS